MAQITLQEFSQEIQQAFPENSPVRKKIETIDGFALEIFPKQIYTLVKCRATAEDVLKKNSENIRITEQRKTIWRVFCGNNATRRYREIAKLLLDRGSNPTREYATWESSPYRREITERWSNLLKEALPEEKENLSKRMGTLIRKEADHDPSVLKRLQTAKRISLEACLTCFTLTGLTLTCFEQKKDTAELFALKQIVYPFSSDEKEKDRDIQEELRKKAAENAKKSLSSIEEEFGRITSSEAADRTCFEKARGVLDIPFLEDSFLLGKANYILYRCSLYPPYVSRIREKEALRYLETSISYSYPDALEEYRLFAERSLTYHAKEASSDKTGLCITNCDNEYTEFCLKTMPCWTWSRQEYRPDDFGQVLSFPEKRYLFFSDDTHQNFLDALKLLEAIRAKKAYDLLRHLEIFIRCEEETYGALIDTAQNYMEGHVARIHLIDDDKSAAQYLLSHHPLFYHLPVGGKNSHSAAVPTLHFVVVGSDLCAEWLIREASWIMTFSSETIRTKISVLCPDPETVIGRLKAKCPGMVRAEHPDANEIKDVPIASFDSLDLEDAVRTLSSKGDYLYFAVSEGSDERNLELAIRIRQQLIRNLVLKENAGNKEIEETRSRLYSLPPVAFRCKNPDVANLSRHMVISNIRQGDAWHNNYALISFGSLDERYSWENLDGGILEKLALCTHMQYCAVPPGTSHSYADDGQGEQDQGAAEAFRSYYGSQYNMDSSLSVALSLPYRLFHMFRAHRRLVKKPWNILDGDAYYSRETLQEFGEELSALGAKSNYSTDQLARWEHLRWTRYMFARGWLPADDGQIEIYRGAGCTKHQLHIARLHPMLREFDRLKEEEKGIDISNLTATRDILRLAWLEKEPEKELQKELEEPEHELM